MSIGLRQNRLNQSPTDSDKGQTVSSITHNLDDRIDVEARKKQATKALGAMMKNVFNNPHLEVKTKRMLYLAIPVNLLLWGSETWALKETDWRSLQVFHTKAIRKILGISMTQVEHQRITNTQILRTFSIELICDIAYSRQL